MSFSNMCVGAEAPNEIFAFFRCLSFSFNDVVSGEKEVGYETKKNTDAVPIPFFDVRILLRCRSRAKFNGFGRVLDSASDAYGTWL
jgi:hypothetical protein